jgi:hypothetical protein
MPFGPLLVSAITKLIEMVVCEQSRYCFNIQSPGRPDLWSTKGKGDDASQMWSRDLAR